jgi:hypothetical protein
VHDGGDDGQSETRAARPGRPGVGAVEPFEDPRGVFGSDTGAVVADLQHRERTIPVRGDLP